MGQEVPKTPQEGSKSTPRTAPELFKSLFSCGFDVISRSRIFRLATAEIALEASQDPSKMAPEAFKTAPWSSQEGPETAQDSPKTAQDAPKTTQDSPKTAQDGAKTALRRPQDGIVKNLYINCCVRLRIEMG